MLFCFENSSSPRYSTRGPRLKEMELWVSSAEFLTLTGEVAEGTPSLTWAHSGH